MPTPGVSLAALAGATVRGPWPATKTVRADTLWKGDRPTVVYAVRRLGWPYCRRLAADLTALRPEFEAAGARLAVITSLDTGVQEFVDAVWPGGEVWVDEEEAFKKAIHGGSGASVRNMWLLKPWVLKNVVSYARSFGSSTADVSDAKTKLLGGTFVVRNGEVVYTHRETSSFDNGDAREVLAAALGTTVAGLAARLPPPTPTAAAVCSRE